MESQVVEIDYTNWRGVRGLRRIRPIPETLRFTSTEYHMAPQWIIDAMDLDKNELRNFAMADVHSWRSIEGDDVLS
mgnify:CR=1 FL=1